MGPPGVRVQPAQLPEKTPAPRKDRDAVGLARASPGWRGGGGLPLPSTRLWRGAGGIYVCPLRPPHAPAPRPSPCPVQTPSLPPAGLLPSPCCHMGAVFPACRADSFLGSCGGQGHKGRTQGLHSPSPARSHCSRRLGEAALPLTSIFSTSM